MFLTHYVQYIRPIMRTYRLRYQVRGCGQLWEKLVITLDLHPRITDKIERINL